MNILWGFFGIGIALLQFGLVLVAVRMQGTTSRLWIMAGKLVLWLCVLVLLGLLGRTPLLLGGVSALGLYTLLVALFWILQKRREKP